MLAMGRVLPALFTLLNFYSCLATSANADDRIRIGVVAPLSGPLGPYGQSLVQGAKDAADRINASNGVLDKKIEIVSFDDAGMQASATAEAHKVADSGLRFVIGHLTRATSIAGAGIYSEKKILQIEPRASRLPSEGPAKENQFSLCGADAERGEVLSYYLTHQLKAHSVGTLSEDDSASRSLISGLGDILSKLGVQVKSSEASSMMDMQSALNRLHNSGPDAIVIRLLEDASYASKLAKMSKLSSKVPMIVDRASSSPVGDMPQPGTPQLLLLQEVDLSVGATSPPTELNDFRKRGPSAANTLLLGFVAVQVIAKGIGETHSVEPSAVSSWLRSNASPTILGDVKFDNTGAGSIWRFAIYQYGAGQLRPDGTNVTCDKGCACKDGGCGCDCPKK